MCCKLKSVSICKSLKLLLGCALSSRHTRAGDASEGKIDASTEAVMPTPRGEVEVGEEGTSVFVVVPLAAGALPEAERARPGACWA